MVANRKVTGRASSFPAGIAAGILSGLTLTLLISLFTAYLISAGVVCQDKTGYCAMATLVLSSGTGAWVGAKRIKRMPMQTAALCAAGYFLLLLSLTALFFGGQYDGMGVTFLIVIIGSGAGGVLAAKEPKKRKQKHYKK